MKIKLLVDYRGVLTEEQYFVAGEYDMPDKWAIGLIAEGRAESLEPERPDNRDEIRVLSDDKPEADISTMSTKKLRAMAKERGLTGYWNMKRETLIERLSD